MVLSLVEAKTQSNCVKKDCIAARKAMKWQKETFFLKTA